MAEKYQKIKKDLDSYQVCLVAVSKTKTNEEIMEAYNQGIRDFGENYVQELVDKQAALPKDIRWHFIGHLQTNKVKYIAPFVHLVHGIDSEKLLMEVNKEAAKINRVIPCLLQVYISRDENKFGFSEPAAKELLIKIKKKLGDFSNVAISGLMGMATFTEDNAMILAEFSKLKRLFDEINREHAVDDAPLTILSMGMSADYMLAAESGSTMVRIGSLIFGERNYRN